MQSKTKVNAEMTFSTALNSGLQISAGADAKKPFIFSIRFIVCTVEGKNTTGILKYQ